MPRHLEWLQNTGEQITLQSGEQVQIWKLAHVPDEEILSDWARHFRQHYCLDTDLPILMDGTQYVSAQDFLTAMKFPDARIAPGPSVRSGDFAEILVTDFAEYMAGYWCPREFRFREKWNRDESSKGCDVIGFKIFSEDLENPNPQDELLALEAKASMNRSKENRLQTAIDHSAKDLVREGITLSSLKQKYLTRGEMENVRKVQRFQNMPDNPFVRKNGAAALLDTTAFDADLLAGSITTNHPNAANLLLLLITGEALMQLVHHLYERAANEA